MTQDLDIVSTVEADAISSLALLAALDDSHSAILIFDPELRVLHATNEFWHLLEIETNRPPKAPEVLNLLSRSSLSLSSRVLARERIAGFRENGSVDCVLLKQETGLTTIRMRIRTLAKNCRAAYFEAVEPVTPPAPRPTVTARDPLTGLASRTCLELALQTALARTPQTPLAVLMIDLDRFKAVNDTLGHPAGDTLLRLVAERLEVTVRKSDIVARFGGDEFGILIDPIVDRSEPTAIARRILDLVQRTYLIDGQLVNVGTSIGIAMVPEDGQDEKTLLRNADLALHQSKTSGRASFNFFDVSMEQRASARRTSELELRQALALRQMEVFYQPQVTMAGVLVGFEALIRWRHPQRGLVPPNDFLPLAEEIGAIIPIGNWVLRTSCAEAMKWPADIVIAVNASPSQIEKGNFADSVKRALQSTGLPGERLEIEITEGTLLGNDEIVMKTLSDLKAMRVRIAMDDFGTGYASLSQLARFPFDKIKIDRSLAGAEGDDRKKRAIVRAITSLGESLGVGTLAEGVESVEQLQRLQIDGCTSLQGYYFGKAVPSTDLQDVIARLHSVDKDESKH